MRQSPHEILADLASAGLINEIGRHAEPSERHAQGVHYHMSHFSGDQIKAYYIDVTRWPDQNYDPGEHLNTEEPDEEVLIRLRGPNWMLSLTRALRESYIEADILEQMLAALPDAEIMTALDIPGPEWFEMPYANTSELAAALVASGFTLLAPELDDEIEVVTANPYLVEALEDDTFSVRRLGRAGNRTTVVIHILVDEHLAARAAESLESYCPWKGTNAIVASDGWAIRLVAPQGSRVPSPTLTVWAQVIGLGLEAPLVVEAHPPHADFGPGTQNVRRALSQLAMLTPGDAEQFQAAWIKRDSAEREAARDRASCLMSDADRRWVELMDLTGPDIEVPRWYADARTGSEPTGALVRSAWGAIYFAQCATVAFAVQDIREDEGGLTVREFDVLTRPWISITGGL